MKDIIDELFSCHELTITREGFQVYFTLKNNETKKDWRSVLPGDHHLDKERVIDCIRFMKDKTK
jgi:hypothetical protein